MKKTYEVSKEEFESLTFAKESNLEQCKIIIQADDGFFVINHDDVAQNEHSATESLIDVSDTVEFLKSFSGLHNIRTVLFMHSHPSPHSSAVYTLDDDYALEMLRGKLLFLRAEVLGGVCATDGGVRVYSCHWCEKEEVKIIVDGKPYKPPTHTPLRGILHRMEMKRNKAFPRIDNFFR